MLSGVPLSEQWAGSDEQLLAGCRSGEEGAWEALVRRYQRLIYAVPRRAGLDEEAASEIFQEVFATLLESIDSIEQPSRLHAWLVTTAKRKTWRAVGRAKAARQFATGEDAAGGGGMYDRSEERRVGEEGRSRGSPYH